MRQESKKFSLLVATVILIGAMGIGLIFNKHFSFIIIKGNYMSPLLKNGQIAVVKKTTDLNYEDIVVFEHEGLNVKRIIGVSGDCIKLYNGRVYVNNVAMSPYSYEGPEKEYLLDDEVFVIGDNYLESYDSRDYGPISVSAVIGIMAFPAKNNTY